MYYTNITKIYKINTLFNVKISFIKQVYRMIFILLNNFLRNKKYSYMNNFII